MRLIRLDFHSPVLLFRLLMGLIAAVATVSLIMVFYTTGQVDSASRQSTDVSDTALLAAESSEKLRELLDILHQRTHAYRTSEEFAELTPAQQAAVEAELSRVIEGPTDPSIYTVLIPLSLPEATAFQATVEYLRSRMTSLLIR
ncbi:MAG TPA: hypothetical protein VG845_02160, partial [Dehalococcoidia bacterium]|nr:hypothetical protein [Dehalococcoidia bacterium]